MLAAVKFDILKNPQASVVLGILLLTLTFSWFSPYFVHLDSWASIMNTAAELGIITLGVTLLLGAGEFDLSVGSTFAFSGMVFALLIEQAHWSGLAALAVALLVGAGIGFLNGWITLITRIPSFITTLGSLFFWRGMVLLMSGGYPVTNEHPTALSHLLATNVGHGFLSSGLWWLLTACVLGYFYRFMPFGIHVRAVGSQAQTSHALGIDDRNIKLICFIGSGFLAALAGIIQFCHLQSLYPVAGDQFELMAITAAVIGGTSLRGGNASILGCVLGTILISMLNTGLVQAGASPYWLRSFIGLILIASVILNKQLHAWMQSK